MGFNYEYKIYANEAVLGERSTILGFFGFTYSSSSETHKYRKKDEIVLESNGSNSYTVRKKYGGTYSKTYEYALFQRNETPMGKERILEDKFYNLIVSDTRYTEPNLWNSYRKDFSPKKTPYLYTSVESYYKKRRMKIGCFGWLIGVVPSISWCIYPVIRNGVGSPEAVLIGAIWCIASVFITSMIRRPYEILSDSKKEKVRKKYLKSLTVGIDEADAILREYAILKEYDKI